MDRRTGQIIPVPYDEAEGRRRGLVATPLVGEDPIPVVNRRQRRAWAAQQRKKARVKAASNPAVATLNRWNDVLNDEVSK